MVKGQSQCRPKCQLPPATFCLFFVFLWCRRELLSSLVQKHTRNARHGQLLYGRGKDGNLMCSEVANQLPCFLSVTYVKPYFLLWLVFSIKPIHSPCRFCLWLFVCSHSSSWKSGAWPPVLLFSTNEVQSNFVIFLHQMEMGNLEYDAEK